MRRCVDFSVAVFIFMIRLIDCVAVSGNGSFVADFPNVSPKRCCLALESRLVQGKIFTVVSGER